MSNRGQTIRFEDETPPKSGRRASIGSPAGKLKDSHGRNRRRAMTAHTPPTKKRSVVLLRVYDLSDGWAALWSSLVIGRKIEGLWHTGIEVFGYEYFYGGGILKMLSNDVEEAFGITPSKIHTLGYTEMTQGEFETYLNEISDSFSKECYDLTRWNCNNFTNHVSEMLLSKGIPRYVLELPEEITSTLTGKLIVNCLNAFRGEPPLTLENPRHPCHSLAKEKETFNKKQKRVQSTPPSPTRRRARECSRDEQKAANHKMRRRWSITGDEGPAAVHRLTSRPTSDRSLNERPSNERPLKPSSDRFVRASEGVKGVSQTNKSMHAKMRQLRNQPRPKCPNPVNGMYIPFKRCDSDPLDTRMVRWASANSINHVHPNDDNNWNFSSSPSKDYSSATPLCTFRPGCSPLLDGEINPFVNKPKENSEVTSPESVASGAALSASKKNVRICQTSRGSRRRRTMVPTSGHISSPEVGPSTTMLRRNLSGQSDKFSLSTSSFSASPCLRPSTNPPRMPGQPTWIPTATHS